MKFKMAPNSLFAILLRNPWWISFLLAAVISLLCAALLPKNLVVFGVLGTIPFLVTGFVALSRQWNAPSAAQLESERARLAGLSWREFAAQLEAKWRREGYEVERLKEGTAADFSISKAAQTTLVAAKRYKAATHGVEALQALVALKNTRDADHAVYFCLSGLTEQAQIFARDHGVQVTSVV